MALMGSAAASPLAAHAQQPMRGIAILMASQEGDAENEARLQALLGALKQLGWSDGGNVRIDVRWAGGSAERTHEIVAEFVALKPDVIVSSGSVATAAFKRATTSIPVVFVLVNEPVAQGFIANLARPAGNITGFTNTDFSVIGKSVELLKTVAPALARVGLLYNAWNYPLYDSYVRALQAQPNRPVEVARTAVRAASDIDQAIDALAAEPGSGLAVLPDGGFTVTNRAAIHAAVVRHRLPSIAPWRQFAAEGALLSYGPDTRDIYRRAADYVDRIIKGAKPAELPVQQPVKFELVINAGTARTLGLTVPPTLLAIADEVIE